MFNSLSSILNNIPIHATTIMEGIITTSRITTMTEEIIITTRITISRGTTVATAETTTMGTTTMIEGTIITTPITEIIVVVVRIATEEVEIAIIEEMAIMTTSLAIKTILMATRGVEITMITMVKGIEDRITTLTTSMGSRTKIIKMEIIANLTPLVEMEDILDRLKLMQVMGLMRRPSKIDFKVF